MEYKLRDGTLIKNDSGQDRFLQKLYGSVVGRMILKPLTCPVISQIAGWVMSSRISVIGIAPFIRKNQIDMSQFEKVKYNSYNEFFSRKIKPEARTIDMDPQHLISPCDSKLMVYSLTARARFTMKHTTYSLSSLLRNRELAHKYEGGYALVFRLTVDDYHRYCYAADGLKGKNVRIPGVLHTVNPIANDYFPIYKENTREYSILQTQEFGDVVMMEVGALMVGKIVNHHGQAQVRRGMEKGYFQFGGSTVVVLVQKERVCLDQDILENSKQGIETIVKYGERIGVCNESSKCI